MARGMPVRRASSVVLTPVPVSAETARSSAAVRFTTLGASVTRSPYASTRWTLMCSSVHPAGVLFTILAL
ncbi:Uncharacterised protein [Mycobacteroides abscessus subsp. massiliense]|nr:Uncharacterised protein [Mycobacteroides abscessus subsp. massiliense]